MTNDTKPTTEQVAKLRLMTGASVTACRDALAASECDERGAIDALRIAGELKAAVISGREARDGAVDAYVHTNRKVLAVVEVNCETDFAANTDDFKRLCRDVAMHVAAHDPTPLSVSAEDLAEDAVRRESELISAKIALEHSKKPEAVRAKIASGQMSKWKREVCLLEQSFVKDPTVSVGALVASVSAKLGERVTIRRFIKMSVGS